MARKPVPPATSFATPFNWKSPEARNRAHGLTIRATHTQDRSRLAAIAGPVPCGSCFQLPAVNGTCGC